MLVDIYCKKVCNFNQNFNLPTFFFNLTRELQFYNFFVCNLCIHEAVGFIGVYNEQFQLKLS